MSIQELGSLGELLGSIAVLVTLFYLSVQTRQAKEVASSEASRNIVVDFQNVWSQLGQSEEFARLVRRGVNDWESLDRDEQLRVHVFLVNLLTHLDAALSQAYLPEVRRWLSGWEENILGLLGTPGGRSWYDTCRYLLSSRLTDRLDARLARPDSLPPPWTEGVPWWRVDASESSGPSV